MFFVFFACITPILIGQELFKEKAKDYFELREYKDAIDNFLKIKDKDYDVLVKLAFSYSKLHKPLISKAYYEKARIEKWPFDYVYMLNYGNVLRELEEYSEAKKVYKRMSIIPLQMIKSCDWVKQSKVVVTKLILDSLALPEASSINGFYKLGDNVLYPFSKSDINYNLRWFNIKNRQSSDFIKFNWQYNLNSPNVIFDSILIYSASSSRKRFFSRHALNKGFISRDKVNKLSLWELNLENKLKAKKLDFINIDYGYAHPYFDTLSSKLFFASDMPGGYGGFDIYYSEYKYGNWSAPINAGYEINTEYDESFPYINKDILFFSSTGHIGYGGYDIYMVDLSDKAAKVINMGKPFNSSKDDFSYREDSIDKGCFVSNRDNAAGRDYLWLFDRDGTLEHL